MAQVLVIEGSRTDDKYTNMFLEVLKACNVNYRVECASAHWYAGQTYVDYINKISEKIIVFIGGMSLVAPGIISAILRNLAKHEYLVFAVPTDAAARSATEDLPVGTPVLTAGLNTISISHSIKNSALDVAKLVLAITGDRNVYEGIHYFFIGMRAGKPLIGMELDKNGLIPAKLSTEG